MKVKRRNFSSRRRRYGTARGIIVSIPKSGRTWLRVFLHAYCCALQHHPFTLDEDEIIASGLPDFVFTHDLWKHRSTANLIDAIRGKHLVPRQAVDCKPILLLSRDPRDILVSLFFQLSKRDRQFNGTLSDLIYDPRFGIVSVIHVMNTWIREWGEKNNFMLLRYENCRQDTRAAFEALLKFFGFDAINEEALNHSLRFSSFDNMKKMEASREFQKGILLPQDPGDPDSFKVRRGIVGGYREYLNVRELHFVEQAMLSLDPRFGYGERKLDPVIPAPQ
jgi:hypothetical protein